MRAGDHVTIGPWTPQKVAWRVVRVDRADAEHTYATISSGNYGVTRVIPIERLHPWAPKQKGRR